ncbi:MAG: DMT family transporter [Bacteroidaceae bacterium]|nr:DMT family transporter [Bacteroidaceae bacterium]
MNSKLLGHIACFVAYTIFGINIIVCKDLTSSHLISPIALFCLRSIGAGLLFWLISLFLPSEQVPRRDLVKIFLASILGFFLTQITFLIAIPDITPMDCSIVSSISPILTMFIAAFALKEPITLRKAGGVALSFFGIIFLILNSVTVSDDSRQTTLQGILLIIANCLSFSLYLGLFKPLIARYSVVTFMKWIFLFATLFSLPFAGGEIVTLRFSALSSTFLFELAYLVVCATFVTYFLIPVGQKRIRPTLVSMYSYVQPIIATTISICLGMDTLGWQKVLAALMVFSGVMLVNFSRSARG